MIAVWFHDGTTVEYPEATMIHTEAAPTIQIVRKFWEPPNQPEYEVIAELDAHDIEEIHDDLGVKKILEPV